MNKLKIHTNKHMSFKIGVTRLSMEESSLDLALAIEKPGKTFRQMDIPKDDLKEVIEVLNAAYNELFAPKEEVVKLCDECQKNEV